MAGQERPEVDIHQRKPKERSMPEAMSKANGRRSKVRSAVEHVFARQKAAAKAAGTPRNPA
jgi:hypothetical protein